MYSDQLTIYDYKNLNFSDVDEWARGWVLGDEWVNGLTHGLGFLLSIIGGFFLIATSIESDQPWKLFSFSVYAITLIVLYASSTIYHTLKIPHLKKTFRTVDHCAIYLLIAGSYTPFSLVILQGMLGWLILSTIWGLTCIGIFLKSFYINRFKKLSTALYLLMGWLVVFASESLISRFPHDGLVLLVAGGLFYTFGVLFFVTDKRKYHHAIWHLFVLGGSISHYFAIALYI